MPNHLLRYSMVGLLLGMLIIPAVPVQAQFTVWDPTNYALQLAKKIEEANRWLETVRHYTTMIDKTVQQLTTMQGVLRNVDEQLARNVRLVRFVSSVGQIVRGSYQLKRQLEGMIHYRIAMLKSIDDRLRNGIFDPQQDLNDLENYLKFTIGRSADETVARLDKLARNDSQLESWCVRRTQVQKDLAVARETLKQAEQQLEAEKNKPDVDQSNVAHLNDVILQHQQHLFRLMYLVMLVLCSALTAHAQTPAPSGPTLSDHIARLSLKASELLPYLQYEVLSHIQDWVYGIAVAVAVLVLLFSFLRLWRENSGANSNLVFFFLRSLFFFGLVGSSVWIIGQMAATGREIAEGNEMNGSAGRSLLFEFYKAQRDSFNESYEKMTMGTFTVKVDGRDFTVRPNTATTGTFVGVLYDNEGTIKDLDKKLNDSSYTLPTLFNWLNASRTILEAGDFWLILLGGVLVLVFKAAAPLMMAVAIDQKLAHKVSYPFVWGAGVLTLIWPAVSYFTRALAYLFGNMAMALGDSEPLYNWDYASMYAIKSNFASPVYTVAIAALMMTIAGGCLWISPYLAYRFSMGQIYEGVSAAMSQFAAMIIGTGVEAYSTTAAASINQAAQNTQAQGSYDAQTTEARANKESGMLRNQAGFIAGKAQALSSAQATAGAAMAAARAGASQAYTMFGSANRGLAGYNENMSQIGTQRSIRDNNTISNRQAREANTDSQVARKEEWSKGLNEVPIIGGPADLVRKWDSGAISTLSGGKYGATPQTLHQRGYDAARIDSTTAMNANATQNFSEAQKVDRQTGDRMAAISMQQGRESAGAAYAAAGTSIAGHKTALGMNNQATQIEFTGRMSSAGITHTAAVDSAKLQAISMIVSRMGAKLAQDIEKGMEMRY